MKCVLISSSRDCSLWQFWKKWTICLDYPGFSSEIVLQFVTAATDSILRLDTSCGYLASQRLDTSYDWGDFWWLDTSQGWLHPLAASSSGGWIRVVADSFPLVFRQLDTSYRSLHPTADSSSGGWIRLKTDSILRLTTSCDWFYSAANWCPPAGLDLRLTYILIYQVILRTYSEKYVIFMVCFLLSDFNYHWPRHWLLLQEPCRS